MNPSRARSTFAAAPGLVAALGLLLLGTPQARPTEPGGSVAFRNMRVFDDTRLTGPTTVVVADGTIVRVGPGVPVPEGVRVVDGSGSRPWCRD